MHGGLFACRRSGGSALAFVLLAALTLSGATGCTDLFNPSFLNIFDASESGEGAFSGVDAPTGHIPILFKNSARFADDVFRFVIQSDTVVRPEVVDELLRENPERTREEIENIIQTILDGDPVDLEELNTPPRVRLTLSVTNVDGGVHRLEFLNGLRLAREQIGEFAGGPLPVDLTENTNSTFIVQCEIAQINIERIDVFVPVTLLLSRNIFNRDGFISGSEVFGDIAPVFNDLEPDEIFETDQSEFGFLRNYDPRFFPPALTTLQCGAVVVIELTGRLFVPFFDTAGFGFVPGFLINDDTFFNRVPGRYAVTISVRN